MTPNSAASNLLYFLGTHPQWLQSIRDEVEGLHEAQVSFANLEKLPVLEACFNEALRLYPPVPFIPRRTVEEAEFKGFKIPAKTVTYLNPLLVHRLPEYWKDPMAFDPDRFLERKEHLQHSHLFVPFGGGAHLCIGKMFGYMEMKAFFVQFVQNFDFELQENYQLNSSILPIPIPSDNLPLKIKRRG